MSEFALPGLRISGLEKVLLGEVLNAESRRAPE